MAVRQDLRNSHDVVQLVAPASLTATTTSAAIDTADYVRASIIINAGVVTDGTFTPSIETSDAAAGSYAPDDGVQNVFTAITASTDAQVYVVDLDLGALDNRYLKFVLTETVASAGGLISATFVGEKRVKD
jgi:hypothetical protein